MSEEKVKRPKVHEESILSDPSLRYWAKMLGMFLASMFAVPAFIAALTYYVCFLAGVGVTEQTRNFIPMTSTVLDTLILVFWIAWAGSRNEK